MGIFGLSTRLRAYTRVYGFDSRSKEDHRAVVIDGPSFAYWIRDRCLEELKKSGDRSEWPVPYSTLAKEAVASLRCLESLGLRIRHIFFDGTVPTSKVQTRLERLQKRLGRLVARRMATPYQMTSFAEPLSIGAFGLVDLPFFIDALLDTLTASEYGDRVKVVLCEAEIACAKYSTKDDYILSNDTDLVILNPEGDLVFFDELELRLHVEAPSIRFRSISTRNFATQCGINDMVLFGFYMSKESNARMYNSAEGMHQCVRTEQDQLELSEFRAIYEASASSLQALNEDNRIGLVLKRTHGRITGLINEIYVAQDEGRPALVFLASLIDDPFRTSAWRSSDQIRHLTYSLLVDSLSPGTIVLEVDRRGQNFVKDEVKLWSVDAVSESVWKLLKIVLGHITIHPEASSKAALWRTLGMLLALQSDLNNGRILPNQCDLLEIVRGNKQSFVWKDLHFSTEVEGTLYSLRMLRQVLEFLYAYSQVRRSSMPPTYMNLLYQLRKLPSIPTLTPEPYACLVAPECAEAFSAQLSPFYRTRGHRNDAEAHQESKEPSDFEKNGKLGNKGKTLLSSTNNPFDILGEASD
ncbi:MAG: hypothetical protein M1828_005770 [Chrysothrix sp. TS-e1954]|nr:MAG: hypothetical protein M1828_005770 [Chrysothrix sp. TS-e1954]